MATLITPPSVFTKEDWVLSNNTKYQNAEQQRAVAERLRAESDRLIDETDKTTKKTQREVNKRLDQRIDDVSFWKSELDKELDDLDAEIENLLHFKERIERALAATEEPLAIAQQCLANRTKRIGIDLVHDDVQRELMKEVEVITGVQALLKRTLEQTIEQIRLDRSAKYYLGKDLKDKFSALTIDDCCAGLNNGSGTINMYSGSAKIEPNSVTPDDWQDFSNENILKAERQKNNSINLRSMTDGILTQTYTDMRDQFDNVNTAFRKRISETRDAKAKLEDHLSKVMNEISDMEGNIDKLMRAIADKEAPMMVSQTRLNERAQRPNVELCRDPVQYRLIGEVNQIDSSISNLKAALSQAESELKGLIRNQLILEEDIDIKSNSLAIDAGQCVPIREYINHQEY